MTLRVIAFALVSCIALPSCVPHGTSAKGRAAQATANCENGYNAQHHISEITPECRRNGAVGPPGTPLPSPT